MIRTIMKEHGYDNAKYADALYKMQKYLNDLIRPHKEISGNKFYDEHPECYSQVHFERIPFISIDKRTLMPFFGTVDIRYDMEEKYISRENCKEIIDIYSKRPNDIHCICSKIAAGMIAIGNIDNILVEIDAYFFREINGVLNGEFDRAKSLERHGAI